MRATPAVAAAAGTITAVVATAVWSWPVGLGLGLVVGLGLAALVERRRTAAVDRMVASVRAWRDQPERHRVGTPGDPELDRLAHEITASGAAVDRRLSAALAEPPWRRALVEALPTASVLFRPDGYVGAANATARDLLGIASDGEPTTLLSALGSAPLAEAVRGTTPGGDPVTVDAQVSGRYVRATITAIDDDRLVLVEDRTRERRVENLRRNFVVNASHELKTPAASIQTLAEALQVVLGTDIQRADRLVDRLQEESTRLVRLVHDLLDLRRLEDRAQVEPATVDVVAAIRAAVAEVGEAATDMDVTVAVDTPATVVRVFCDPDDLRLVVRNLVSNGVQYNRPGGRLDIRVAVAGAAVVVAVHDTGIGIPRADLDRVFERFYRVDVARSRETGGTGLGLSLVRHAVERNGGSVDVESLLGSGSTFTVHLPAVDRPPLVVDDQAAEPADVEVAIPGPASRE